MTHYWNCKFCGNSTYNEYYMVTDAVWNKAHCKTGFVCVGCIETRLGRNLTFQDFKHVPCNWLPFDMPKSPRLQSRLYVPREARGEIVSGVLDFLKRHWQDAAKKERAAAFLNDWQCGKIVKRHPKEMAM